ncbi:MAG: hypothetical protein J6T13_04505 [Bacteroidales bacterium]|nr:hypothetical protein [Bacteroidales bacterium]
MKIIPLTTFLTLLALVLCGCKSQDYVTICYKPGTDRVGYCMNIPYTRQVSYLLGGSDLCYIFEYNRDSITSYLFIEYADNSFNGWWQFLINNMLEKYGEQAYKMVNTDTAQYVASYLVVDSTGVSFPVYQLQRKNRIFNESGQWLGNTRFKLLDTLSTVKIDTIVYDGISNGLAWKWFHVSYGITVGYANVPLSEKCHFEDCISSLHVLQPDLIGGDNFWRTYLANEKGKGRQLPRIRLKQILLNNQPHMISHPITADF